VASYDASINVRVTGTGMVDGVLNRVQELERLVKEINTKPLNLSKIAGRGELADRFGAAAKELNSLKQSFINTEKAVQAFGTTTNRTIANTTALAATFKRIAENSDVATSQFREFTVAAQQAAVAANTLGRNRLGVLREELSFGGKEGKTIGGGGLVAELLAQERQVPKSIAALEAYQAELNDLIKLVDLASPEFQQLAEAIARVDKVLGTGPKQKTPRGPTSPIRGREDIPGSPKALEAAAAKRSKLFENLALGAGFPLLFGGGPGQVLGGLLGSFAGPGFGGQILGSAIFGQLEQLGVSANQAGAALQKPIDNFGIIEQRALLASSSQEKYVKNLIDAGQYIEATAAVQKRYNEIIGTQGSQDLLDLTASADRLTRAWSELNLQIQAALAGPLADLLNWVARFIEAGSGANREAATQQEIFNRLSPEQQKEFKRREQEILQGANIFNEAAKREQVAEMARQFGGPQQAQTASPGFQATEVAQTASLERRREIQAQITKLREAELSSAQKQIQLDTSILTKQLEFATSLNQQSALIDKIAAKKVESANAEYQLVQRQQQTAVINAKLALEGAQAKATAAQEEMKNLDAAGKLTETKKAELQATIDKVFVAEKDLTTTQKIAGVVTQRAQKEREVAATMADVERRQQQVAAFATEVAAQTERFNQAANQAVNALNNNLKVIDAYSQAQLTVNNLEIQSLQNQLAQAETQGERLDILDRIRDLEIANAGITLQATRAQIAAEVERQRIALAMADVKYRELQAVVNLARAQKVLTQDHIRALEAQRSALVIAQQNYSTSQAVANEQYRAADAVYNAAVNAANLKMNLEGSAAAAGAIAGSMERAAAASSGAGGGGGGGGGGGYLTASNIQNPILRAKAEQQIKEIDRRTGIGQGAVFANLAARQEVVLDYMAMEKKAAREQEMKSAAEELRNMGLYQFIPPQYRTEEDRTAIFSRYGASGAGKRTSAVSPQVNITTGPVMQMDGTNYVTQRDLVSATGEAARKGANMALGMLQNNPAARRRTGVTQ
jgi:hypothetical protein